MTSVFIGSSSEALASGALDAVVSAAQLALPGAVIRPWPTIFQQGNYALQSLLDETSLSDFAILIFAKDDHLTYRGEKTHSARGNVLLESGLFLHALGPRRVAHVVEGTVAVPTDLNGLTTIRVKSLAPEDLAKAAEKIEVELRSTWGDCRDLDEFGLARTLRMMRDRASGTQEHLVLGRPQKDPVILDSQPCQDAYKEALAHVSKRFWTTTYLTSGFWTTNAAQALAANRGLLRRLGEQRSVRRLFLLPRTPADFIEEERSRITHLRDAGQEDAMRRHLEEIRTHERNVRQLNADGCDTRVVYDFSDGSWGRLNAVAQKRYRPGDTEVAIYDDFRIDMFSGGASGAIDRVICFLPTTDQFSEVLFAGEDYFTSLWSGGSDALAFVTEWREACERASESLTYAPHWQWAFDHDLTPHDESLKLGEFTALVEYLKGADELDVQSYLDIGTCTGRYPEALVRGRYLPNLRKVVALDADPHCCRTARNKLKNFVLEELDTPCADYLVWAQDTDRKFDLITCMLGTLSHFGAPVSSDGRGRVREAISFMGKTLNQRGALVLATWSRTAMTNQDFLLLYSASARERLARWSPTRSDMVNMLTEAEFTFEVRDVGSRLHLWLCRPKVTPDLRN